MTYRQMLTDLSLAALLAAPTLTLARPTAEPAATSIVAGKALYLAVGTPRPGERPRSG